MARALARRLRGGVPVVLLRKESCWDDCSVGSLARHIGGRKFSEYRVSYLILSRDRPQLEKHLLYNISAKNYTKLAKPVGVIVHTEMLVNLTRPGIYTMGYVRFDSRSETLTSFIRSLKELIDSYLNLQLWIFNTSRLVYSTPTILILQSLVRSFCSRRGTVPNTIIRYVSSRSPHHQDCKFWYKIKCHCLETATKTPFAQGQRW